MAASNRTDEKPTTEIRDFVSALTPRVGRVLGTDQRGREHCFWPHAGEITVRERGGEGPGYVTVERIDLEDKTIHDYRRFVEREVEDVEVDWIERVFER